ncbi:SpoIIE family protein phosphatase [Geodermatophilus sp. SYSU D00814]
MDLPLPVTVPEQRPGSPGEAPRPLSLLPDDAEVSRLRFELAIDAAGIGSFDWDLLTGRLAWDEQLLSLFGYRPGGFDETIEAFAARLHPDDRDRTLQALQEAVETVGTYEAEFRVVLPSGDTRWVQGRGRALADSRGRAVRLLGAALDTTRLREGDARVSRVLETMRSAFFALDRSWRFTYVNAEAERVLHRSRDELLGGDLWELFPAAVGSDFEVNYRAVMERGEERVFDAHYPPPLDAWYEVRAWPGPDGLSVYFLDVTERRAAEERARASAARLTLLAEVSALMSATPGSAAAEQAALQRVAEAVVPVLGDWAILTLADGTDGRMHDVASWHADPAMRPATAAYAGLRLASIAPDAPVLQALGSGRLLTVADVPAVVRPTLPEGEVLEVFDALAPRTAVTLPLLARGRTLGALSVYRGADRPAATAEDVAAAREVADRVALALDNARLFDQQRRLAEALQRSLLTAPPQPDDAEIVVRYQPAVQVAQVGGDWYDAFLPRDGSTVLVIGDVVGHDTEAAAAMGQLRGMLRGIAHRGDNPPDAVLAELDDAMEALGLHTMATAVVARVEQTPQQRAAGTTTLRWSNAGHPVPLLLTPEGEVHRLGGARGQLMLGVDPGAHRTSQELEVRRGSTLLLYTDGLVEGRDLLLDEGTDRLCAALAQLADLPLERLCDALVTRLQPEGLQDDVALVAIRLHPQG